MYDDQKKIDPLQSASSQPSNLSLFTPSLGESHYVEAQNLSHQGKLRESMQQYEKAIECNYFPAYIRLTHYLTKYFSHNPKNEERIIAYKEKIKEFLPCYILDEEKSKNADTQNNLGFCYEKGIGVLKDPVKAKIFYELSAEQGHVDAQYNLGLCYMNAIGVEQDNAKSVECFNLSAQQGHADAQYSLGLCYENGVGVEKNTEKAIYLYTLSAKQGHASAQYKLGLCYENADGVEKNTEEAIRWYFLSAKQGHIKSLTNYRFLNWLKINDWQELL